MKLYDIKIKLTKTVFTIFSLVLLCSNWIVSYGEFEYDWTGYRNEISDTMYMLENVAAWSGNKIDTSGAEKVINCVLDGKISALEMVTIAIQGDDILRNTVFSDFKFDELNTLRALLNTFLVCFLGTIISAIIMLYCIWKKGYATLEKIFFITYLTLLGIMCIFCLSTFNSVTEQMIFRPTIMAILAVVCAVPSVCLEKLPIYNNPWNKIRKLIKGIEKR